METLTIKQIEGELKLCYAPPRTPHNANQMRKNQRNKIHTLFTITAKSKYTQGFCIGKKALFMPKEYLGQRFEIILKPRIPKNATNQPTNTI